MLIFSEINRHCASGGDEGTGGLMDNPQGSDLVVKSFDTIKHGK
jgi:hypothetical protein